MSVHGLKGLTCIGLCSKLHIWTKTMSWWLLIIWMGHWFVQKNCLHLCTENTEEEKKIGNSNSVVLISVKLTVGCSQLNVSQNKMRPGAPWWGPLVNCFPSFGITSLPVVRRDNKLRSCVCVSSLMVPWRNEKIPPLMYFQHTDCGICVAGTSADIWTSLLSSSLRWFSWAVCLDTWSLLSSINGSRLSRTSPSVLLPC